MSLSGGGGEAAGDVVGNVSVEKFEQALAHRAGSSNAVAGDFSHANQIAVRRGDENFFGGVEVLGAKRLLDDRESGFRRNLQEDAARDAFQAAGAERWRKNLPVL